MNAPTSSSPALVSAALFPAFPVGATLAPGGGVTYRVWAPDRQRVRVAWGADQPTRFLDLHRDDHGFFSATDESGRAGDLYRFELDGDALLPDPASRFQPQGVFGPSQVVDATVYSWQTAGWSRPALQGRVIYEVHLGTFTGDGTFRSAIERLDDVVALGANAIEIMPVADFPGRWNWGYDGVALFAPARCYGTPDDLRALVDAAHARGLAVILDVVYNHLGPVGNFLEQFAKDYFHAARDNPWGRSLNFDGRNNGAVRAFFLQNAAYWLDEFRIDGLRLDATHAMEDASSPHIVAELGTVVHARGAFAIAENEFNDANIVSEGEGGWGLDGVWADDFHHTVRVALTGQRDAHFSAYAGTIDEWADALTHGWVYRGQFFNRWNKNRGTPSRHVPPERFVYCISNHDQVGNRAFGERLHDGLSPAVYRTASVLLCLAPYTPMLFMGQEWAASSPFLFFTDHPGEVGEKMAENRIKEFRHYGANVDPELLNRMPDPQAESTFARSKLRWEERNEAAHTPTLTLYRELLQLRAREVIFQNPPRERWSVARIGAHGVGVRWSDAAGDWLLLVTIATDGALRWQDDAFTAPRADRRWCTVLDSNERRFGGDAVPPVIVDAKTPADLAGPGAWLLHEE